MKSRAILIGILLSIVCVFGCKAGEDSSPVPKGPSLGQSPPGLSPEIFAPGIVSTEAGEFNAAFFPDGKEFLYSVNEPSGRETMKFMIFKDDRWTPPQPVPFASPQNDCDPFFSFDGRRLYFISTRPKKDSARSGDWDMRFSSCLSSMSVRRFIC